MAYIETRRDGAVLIVTINRPHVLNALHFEADQELEQAWSAFETDTTLRVAILTGAGERAFSAGNDLKEHAKRGSRAMLPTGFGALTARRMSKPIIAAVNGIAVGGGFELALSCDLIVADRRAEFALPEPRVGLAALAGGIQRVVEMAGMPRAMGIVLTGRRVPALEAMKLGLVTALAEEGRSVEVALDWAARIVDCSPAAVTAAKIIARESSLSDGSRIVLDDAHPAVRHLKSSPDYLEGPRAFAEKRKARWASGS